MRVVLLRIMLWALALAAVIGVAAVLFEGGWLAWRVVGTAISTAIACALLMAASRLVDREKSRASGLLGMVGVIIEFLGSLALIWELPSHLLRGRFEDEIFLTLLALGLAVLLCMVLLRAAHSRSAVVAARTGIYVTIVTLVCCLLGTWSRYYGVAGPQSWDLQHNWGETGVTVFLFGGLASVGLIGVQAGDRRYWRWAGVLASLVGCAMVITEIWLGTGSHPGFVVFCILLSLAAVVAHANVCLMCPLAAGQGWVRVATIVAAVLTAVCLDVLAIDHRLKLAVVDSSVFGRLAAAAGIAGGCGTLALGVLARLNRVVDFEPLSPELTAVSVICPRCSKKQTIGLGDSACSTCRLRISIKIEEPRCPNCGYLLYGLPSSRCPECGTVLDGSAGG